MAKQSERLQRLLPNGYPRYVRCYDSGSGLDRYTVVFTGRYNNRVERSRREYVHFGMSEDPLNGIGQMGFSKEIIDVEDGRWAPEYGKSNHLGKRIHWHEMPEKCQKAALHVYKEIWELYAPENKNLPDKFLLPGFPVEFKSSKDKTLAGVLVEEDALYDAWHVRMSSRPPGLDPAISHHVVMVDTDRLLKPAATVVKAKINGFRWKCSGCNFENESDEAAHSHMVSCCSECRKLHHIVLTDASDDILTAGAPFPE